MTGTSTDIDAADVEAEAKRTEERVVATVRELARELGGDRAARAVTSTASLERDVGLGSLERVELLTRLESELGRELGDKFLLLETPRDIARAIPDAPARRGAAAASVASVAREPSSSTNVRVDDAATLVGALRRRATAEPARQHVMLHSDTGMQRVSYGELWDGAARIAGSLAANGVKRGDTVAIMLPTGLDYLQSFMGILVAGGVAVPLYPPARLDRLAEYLQRQARMLANANSRVMIAMPEAAPIARMLRHDAPRLEIIATAEAMRSGSAPVAPTAGDDGDPEDVALIQYTSGSTGDPKGVVLTNANLLANIRAIAGGAQFTSRDAIVSWLPLYHDMGLIGAWLNAMVTGVPLTLMSPLSFLARPERWLWAIHEQRATHSPAPNFAYELCVRKIRDEALEGLDLSSWRCAPNGSEPVSTGTLERFAHRFERYGFHKEALFPVYGLAESSVALSFPPLGRAPLIDVVEREPFAHDGLAVAAAGESESTLSFVSVGQPLPGHEIRLTDDAGADVAERVIGRLSFRGPSCMSEYYRNDEATARTISTDGWIDSGDLAYRSNGELFITGRIKDLIIKGGRNIVPQEIEEVVGAIDGIRKGCVAAFGVADESSGTERLVVLAESRMTAADERARLERDVIGAVAGQVGVPPDVVCIVPPGVVPKTPSGKVRRAAAREAYEGGTINAPPRLPIRLKISLAFGRVRGIARGVARWIGRALQLVYLVVVWMIAALTLGPVIVILALVLPSGRPMRILSRVIARVALGISGCRLEIEGVEHLPERGPAVFVTNHTSYSDTLALLAALTTDFGFVAMTELLAWPVIGALVRRGRHLTVDRWHTQQSVADAAAIEQRLREGEAILFFAEGGFSGVRGLRPFRLGAFQSAVSTGAPVIPIALRGTRDLLPADARLPHPGRIHVWIGEPIHPTGKDWKAVVDLRDRASDAVAAQCGEPRIPSALLNSR